MQQQVALICRACATRLQPTADALVCPTCRVLTPLLDGIAFIDDPLLTQQQLEEHRAGGEQSVTAHRQLLHARHGRQHGEPYAWFRPFNESSRALDRFLPLIAATLDSGAPILDLWNRTGWTGALLAGLFPDHPVVSIWEGNTEVLGHGGFLHWMSSHRRPPNLQLLFVSPTGPLPFEADTFGFVHGLDTLHRYPPSPLLGECLRVARSGAPIAFPHVHLTNSEPEPFFERGCTQLHGRVWSNHLNEMLAGSDRVAWVLSEPAAFDPSASLELVDDPDTTDYNATVLIGPHRWDGMTIPPAPQPLLVDDTTVLVNPLVTIDASTGRVLLDRSARGGTVGHMIDRHESSAKAVLASVGSTLSSHATAIASLASAAMNRGRMCSIIADVAMVDRGIEELVATGIAISAPAGPAAAALQRQATDLWPERGLTFADIWDELKFRYQQRPVIASSDGGAFHLADVQEIVDAIRVLLASRNVEPGDRILIVDTPHPEMLLVTWAAWLSGAVLVPISASVSPDRLRELVAVAQPVLAFGDAQGVLSLGPLGLPSIEFDPLDASQPEHPNHLAVMLDPYLDQPAPAEVHTPEDSDAAIVFTSGTTGPAKGVRISHRSLCWTAGVVVDVFDWSGTDIVWSLAAFDTMSGLRNPAVAALRAGATIAIAANEDRFGPLKVTETADRMGVTVLCAGPALVTALAAVTDRLDGRLRSLRLLLTTGAALDPAAAEATETAFDLLVRDYYGLTETGGICLGVPPRESPTGTLGRAVGAIVEVHRGGQRLPAGQVGEIRVTGPGISSGYLGAVQGVRRVDGWIWTGDQGRLRSDGTVEYLGRNDHQLKSSDGRIVDGQAIVAVLENVAAVVSAEIRNDDRGRILAVVTARQVDLANTADAASLRALVLEQLGADVGLDRVELIEQPS